MRVAMLTGTIRFILMVELLEIKLILLKKRLITLQRISQNNRARMKKKEIIKIQKIDVKT